MNCLGGYLTDDCNGQAACLATRGSQITALFGGRAPRLVYCCVGSNAENPWVCLIHDRCQLLGADVMSRGFSTKRSVDSGGMTRRQDLRDREETQ